MQYDGVVPVRGLKLFLCAAAVAVATDFYPCSSRFQTTIRQGVYTPTSNSRPIPKKIFDYDVIDRIGEGARSVIYAVSHPKTRQIYALKHVKRETDKDDRFIDQVLNEYEVGRKINHPGLRRASRCGPAATCS